MIIKPDVVSWSPSKVCDWIANLLGGDAVWIDEDFFRSNRIDGRKLLLLSADDLKAIGAKKVGVQERILEAIDDLRNQLHTTNKETLQNKIFNLGCCSRMLYSHLVHKRIWEATRPDHVVSLMEDSSDDDNQKIKKQDKVLLDTLSFVSVVVEAVQRVVEIISKPTFKDNTELRSMRSLILALGIELASTAQRDQFVEKPNEILERSSKVLADYCDRITQNTKDPILIQAL